MSRPGGFAFAMNLSRADHVLPTMARFLLPFAFLALLPIGAALGGGWTFLAAIVTLATLLAQDGLGSAELIRGGTATGAISRWIPRAYILLQLAATAWAASLVARGTRPIELVGLIASTGVTAGIFGFLAAHELVHSRDRCERALGMLFLASTFYLHFRIAHLFGHHRRAATFDDPATARLGESLYAFVLRSILGQFRESWEHETKRLGRSHRHGFDNRVIAYLAIELSTVAILAVISVPVLIYLLCVAVIAVGLLETFNYVAHYGILRRRQPNGKFEQLQPRHSWNSRGTINNAALFNMGRHSDHHRHPSRSYDLLAPIADETVLPTGYARAMAMAFVPALWRRRMDMRAKAAVARSEGLEPPTSGFEARRSIQLS